MVVYGRPWQRRTVQIRTLKTVHEIGLALSVGCARVHMQGKGGQMSETVRSCPFSPIFPPSGFLLCVARSRLPRWPSPHPPSLALSDILLFLPFVNTRPSFFLHLFILYVSRHSVLIPLRRSTGPALRLSRRAEGSPAGSTAAVWSAFETSRARQQGQASSVVLGTVGERRLAVLTCYKPAAAAQPTHARAPWSPFRLNSRVSRIVFRQTKRVAFRQAHRPRLLTSCRVKATGERKADSVQGGH